MSHTFQFADPGASIPQSGDTVVLYIDTAGFTKDGKRHKQEWHVKGAPNIIFKYGRPGT